MNTRLYKYLYTFKDVLIKIEKKLWGVETREWFLKNIEFCISGMPGNTVNTLKHLLNDWLTLFGGGYFMYVGREWKGGFGGAKLP